MRTRLLGGLGALATLAAGAVAYRPELVDAVPLVDPLVETLPPGRLLLALGLAVLAFAAVTARGGSAARAAERAARASPTARFARTGTAPEVASAAGRARTGGSFDDRVGAACSGDDLALRMVRESLADTAAYAVARPGGREPEAARRAVETGAWTDDRLAAAFLADDDGPDAPLAARLRAWLDPPAERRRRINRTVDAVEAAAERDRLGGER
ncbi:DUF7269 family protein [Halorussus halobius]|uniref:DUF7269 family protein n=1 Tax=Halorussus halobius TaxID=1710537 RepID=UPI0010929798|nr:hypothetical protein [Halorussus halobius]